ncbi:DinB superfamily protein [Sphingobacterium nematocida]|uniref:DinB superfamily protein n=1 Tax=Sphingobacterium nematocida TaxID=1513896 RepID=A0A1T5ANQ2_9SPHI|nr:DinB family protein [Sphingobacterium nematocida]SKB36460.1 DinB superfamily protein [Sphingobacterium nematocida]
MKASELINELIEQTEKHQAIVEGFKKMNVAQLQYKQSPESWSILECIEHLNRYGDFYIPELSKRIEASKHKQSTQFKPGILGDYFARIMLPREGGKKIKTFQSMDPRGSELEIDVLERFLGHISHLLLLLEKSRNTDLTKVKTAISITRWIKLRLGDTFRVVVYHNFRHIVQCQNILETLK